MSGGQCMKRERERKREIERDLQLPPFSPPSLRRDNCYFVSFSTQPPSEIRKEKLSGVRETSNSESIQFLCCDGVEPRPRSRKIAEGIGSGN